MLDYEKVLEKIHLRDKSFYHMYQYMYRQSAYLTALIIYGLWVIVRLVLLLRIQTNSNIQSCLRTVSE